MDKKEHIKSGFTTNYIRLFNAIYETNSIAEAAKQLDITQPSATNGLKKVREICDDELFTKDGHKLIPNNRATRLYTIWKETITTLDKGLKDEGEPINKSPLSLRERGADILVAYSSDLNSMVESNVLDAFKTLYKRKDDKLDLFSFSAYRSNTYKIPTKKNAMPPDIIISTKKMDHLVGWSKYTITGFPLLILTPKKQDPHISADDGSFIQPGDLRPLIMTSDAIYTASPYLDKYSFNPVPQFVMDNSRAATRSALANEWNLILNYSPKIDSLIEKAQKSHSISIAPEILSRIYIYSQDHISDNILHLARLIGVGLSFVAEKTHKNLSNRSFSVIIPDNP